MGDNLIPNSFQVPNVYIDRLMPLLTDGEFRVLMVSLRHRGLPAGLSVFVQALGMEEHAVAAALNGLVHYNVMTMRQKDKSGLGLHTYFEPVGVASVIRWASLEQRRDGNEAGTLLPDRADDELDAQEYALLARYLRACSGGRGTCTERANADDEGTTRYARQRLAEKGWIEVRNEGKHVTVTPTVKAWLGIGE